MRILLTGAHGLLGQNFTANVLRDSTHTLLATGRTHDTFYDTSRVAYAELDIRDADAVRKLVDDYKPDTIVNAAAFTNVDKCEIEKEESWAVNVGGVKHLVDALADNPGSHLVHISTNYVFDGGKQGCYTEESEVHPINYYGEEKLASEKVVAGSGVSSTLLRTQGLYGTGYDVKKDYVSWVVGMLKKGEPFGAIVDQRQNWTLADDLARICLRAAELRAKGLYHACGAEPVTRLEFAQAIADEYGYDNNIVGITYTSELGQLAKRPENSAFCIDKLKETLKYEPCGITSGLKKYRELLGRERHYIHRNINEKHKAG